MFFFLYRKPESPKVLTKRKNESPSSGLFDNQTLKKKAIKVDDDDDCDYQILQDLEDCSDTTLNCDPVYVYNVIIGNDSQKKTEQMGK